MNIYVKYSNTKYKNYTKYNSNESIIIKYNYEILLTLKELLPKIYLFKLVKY